MDRVSDQGLAEAIERWTLSDVTLVADTRTSVVRRARRADGAHVALKILKPYGADEIHGARLMSWWNGDGAARIIDIAEPAILMQWLDGPPLGDLVRSDGRDDEATGILCDVAARLHRVRATGPKHLMSLRRSFRPLLDGDPDDWEPANRDIAKRAAVLAEELLATTMDVVPLHGDFHHDNVVGSERGWLALDPKGIVGDRHYEFANVFRNPYGGGDIARDPKRIDARASIISKRLGLDRRRLLLWAAAHCALSERWNRAAGDKSEWNFLMLPLLLEAAERAPHQ
jgi:streptomycin 6-kinase